MGIGRRGASRPGSPDHLGVRIGTSLDAAPSIDSLTVPQLPAAVETTASVL
jgi:hypothetical protein